MMPERFAELHFSEAPKIVVKPPGPNAKKLLEKQKQLDSRAVFYPLVVPTAWEEGRGATLKDVDGNFYIDFFAGVAVLAVGHSNPVVVEVVKKQAEKIIHALDIPTPQRIELIEKLIEIAPGNLKGNAKVLFGGPTGSDAVEAAIKLARFNTKRRAIIAFEGSYHGMTAGALAVTGKKSFKTGYSTLMPDVHFAPYAYCYRCVFGKTFPECDFQCVKYVDHILEDPDAGIAEPAAVIVEPVQGEGGIIVPPKGYLSELKKTCEKNNVLLIVDEIQSGFARTGKMFACEHDNVTPDIMPIAKAVGGIGLPLAGIVLRKELDTWEPGGHVGTFRGNVLACAAGLAGIKFMLDNNLADHASKLGGHMLKRLNEIAEQSKYAGEARGKGLMCAIEFVEDKKTKKPAVEFVKKVQTKCLERGIVVWKAGHWPNVIRFLPPLVITRDLVDKGLDIFSEAVKEVERSV